jgi:hypothetical protein
LGKPHLSHDLLSMKSPLPRLTALRRLLLRPALLAAMTVSLSISALSARAAGTDNISTEQQGAVVIYSTPLAKGASPESLLNGEPGSLSFSRKATGPRVLVIDLGKSYQLGGVRLKFSRHVDLKVYVLKTKPDANTSWASYVAGLQPDGVLQSSNEPVTLGGAQGEYLVIVSDRNPGAFSGLYVTGLSYFHPDQFTRDMTPPSSGGQNGSTTLAETPPPVSAYSQTPSVPPQSH